MVGWNGEKEQPKDPWKPHWWSQICLISSDAHEIVIAMGNVMITGWILMEFQGFYGIYMHIPIYIYIYLHIHIHIYIYMWLYYIWLYYIWLCVYIYTTCVFIYIYTLYFQASPFPFSNGTSCPHPQGRHFNNTSSWKPFAGNVGRLGVAAEVFLFWYWNHFRKPLDFLWDFHGTANGGLV